MGQANTLCCSVCARDGEVFPGTSVEAAQGFIGEKNVKDMRFRVRLKKEGTKDRFGIGFQHKNGIILIEKVLEGRGYAAERWNASCRQQGNLTQILCPGLEVLEVNGIGGDVAKMKETILNEDEIELRLTPKTNCIFT